MSVDEITLETLALKIKFLEDQVHSDVVEQGEKLDSINTKLDKILPILQSFIPRIQALEEEMKNTRPWISAEDKEELKAEIKAIKERWDKES